MKITTYARFEWNGTEYAQVEEDSFEYDGPIDQCMPGVGSGDNEPGDYGGSLGGFGGFGGSRGMPGDDPSVAGGGWAGFDVEDRSAEISFSSFVNDLLGTFGLGPYAGRKSRGLPGDDPAYKDKNWEGFEKELGIEDFRERFGRMNAARIGKIFGGIAGLGIPGLGIGTGMQLGGKIGTGAYNTFGNPKEQSAFTDAPFSYEAPTEPIDPQNPSGGESQRIAELLAGIFQNKGNVNVNEFINSLLNSGRP